MTTTKMGQTVNEKKSKTINTRSETVSDVRAELAAEGSGSSGSSDCPVCGQKGIKSLRHHVNYRAAAGDVAHAEYKSSQSRRPVSPAVDEGPYFADGSGAALVGILLSFILQKRPGLKIPEGWPAAAGEAHQVVLEKHIGPRLKGKSDLAYLVMIWAQLLTVNLVSLGGDTEAEAAAGPVDVPLEPDIKKTSS